MLSNKLNKSLRIYYIHKYRRYIYIFVKYTINISIDMLILCEFCEKRNLWHSPTYQGARTVVFDFRTKKITSGRVSGKASIRQIPKTHAIDYGSFSSVNSPAEFFIFSNIIYFAKFFTIL